MKKYLTTLAICLLSFTIVLSGCTPAPLENSPSNTSTTCVYGSALTYDDYIYFANSYKEASSITTKSGNSNVDNPAIFRVQTTNGEISYNADTNLPENHDKVVGKVAGFNSSFMYSVGEYIYFATPSIHEDSALKVESSYNSYFVVKTDGTGLKEFYSTKATITQQTVLTLNNKNYLVLADGAKLVRIELNGLSTSTTIIADDFTSVIFAKSILHQNDKFAYYLKNIEEEKTNNNITGSYLYKVDLSVGKTSETLLNQNSPSTITFKQVYNGQLFFTIEENSGTFYSQLDTSAISLSSKNNITIANSTFTQFTVIYSNNTEKYYYIISSTANKTYIFNNSSTEITKPENLLIEKSINILFTYGEYLYYSVEGDGIYKVSVQNKTLKEKIVDLANLTLQTNGISFDGTYIYFYGTSTDYTSGTYYMHRAQVNTGSANLELLSKILEIDEPTEE